MKLKNFVFKSDPGYYSHIHGNKEICLEPCLNGFDVAIYENQSLLEPKVCTNIEKYNAWSRDSSIAALSKALSLAKGFKQKYPLQNT